MRFFLLGLETQFDIRLLFYAKIHVAENGKRSIAERLFKGEAYRPYRLCI
jgi:hypothetical protein